MAYVKILESELNELIALKDEYYNNCIKLYTDIQNRDTIIKAIKTECEQACADKQALLDSLDEDVVAASDAASKRTTVTALMGNVSSANENADIIAMKEKYLK